MVSDTAFPASSSHPVALLAARRRWLALVVLALLSAAMHLWLVNVFGERLGAFAPEGSSLQRMDVAFVRQLEPTAPPQAPMPSPPPPATPEAQPLGVKAPEPAASSPRATRRSRDADASRKKPPIPERVASTERSSESMRVAASSDAPVDTPPPVTEDPAAGVQPPAASGETRAGHADHAGASTQDATATADAPPAFVGEPLAVPGSSVARSANTNRNAAGAAFGWPPSTQLHYLLKGNYRGEVEGSATVQWVRVGERYEVRLDVAIGPSFAPLMSRQMVSQGVLSEAGLVPQRYDERTRIGFSVRQLSMAFDAARAVLADGSSVPMPRGMQDASSQFVQLSYLFTTNPALLQAGRSVSLPVALPRRVNTWTYDIVGDELLTTPIGELQTFHVRPRRDSPRPGELVAQAWYAPTLQYLPVRILIHQDADSFIDLQIDQKPLQAER